MLENNGGNKKPLIFYVVIVSTIILLLNAFIFPLMMTRQVQVIGYSDFLSWIEEGKVVEVSLTQEASQIIFVARNDKGQEELYKTAVFPDDGLIERLQKAGIRFSAEIPTQNNSLLSFIISWILLFTLNPVTLFLICSQRGHIYG